MFHSRSCLFPRRHPPLLIQYRNVHNIDNDSEETSNITILFRSKLYDCAHTPIYLVPDRLRKPTTTEEGLKSFPVRRNNRPLGLDSIPMELLDPSPPTVAFKLATFINHFAATATRLVLRSLNHGVVLALPKPNKPHGNDSRLRPITYLNTTGE